MIALNQIAIFTLAKYVEKMHKKPACEYFVELGNYYGQW
jgi:hypothetical protein